MTISIPMGSAVTNLGPEFTLNPLIIPPSPVLRLEIIKLYQDKVKLKDTNTLS